MWTEKVSKKGQGNSLEMAKKKLKTVLVKLASMAGTGFFYMTRKNPQKVKHKIVLRKYDPTVQRHVLFEERKLKKGQPKGKKK